MDSADEIREYSMKLIQQIVEEALGESILFSLYDRDICLFFQMVFQKTSIQWLTNLNKQQILLDEIIIFRHLTDKGY